MTVLELLFLAALLWGGAELFDAEDQLPNTVRTVIGEDCSGEVSAARDALAEANRTCSVDIAENAQDLIDDKVNELRDRVQGAAEQLGGLQELLDR